MGRITLAAGTIVAITWDDGDTVSTDGRKVIFRTKRPMIVEDPENHPFQENLWEGMKKWLIRFPWWASAAGRGTADLAVVQVGPDYD